MALEKILSVSGKPGLYRLVGQMKNGIIVEAIADGKRFPVHGASKVSALGEISIYTHEDEVPLKNIFKSIFEKEGGKSALDHKADNNAIKAYFEAIVPNYDPERVYISDMAKVVKWYNLLVENKAYDPAEEEKEEQEATAEEKTEATEAKDASKPAKKTAAKKSAAAKPAAKSAAKPKPASAKSVSSPRKAGGSQRGS